LAPAANGEAETFVDCEMRSVFLLAVMLIATAMFAQQGVTSTDTIQSPTPDRNYNKPLYSDSLSSSFYIEIPKEVKPHYHANHTEQVIVLSGEADMMLGDQKIHIRKGDVIFIPKGTKHSVTVTSAEPLKIISVQAPYFDGSDRVMIQK
jgi:mannose-6-phosphate isomerase-like protein (cupin superfamily)